MNDSTAVVEQQPSRVALLPLAERQPQTLVERFAGRYHVDPSKLLVTLKHTAFKQRDGEVSNEQMMALLVVADQYKLNPFTKEIFAFPDRSGIVPVVGVDGWSRIINEHPQFDGMDIVVSEDGASCTCSIHRKDRAHPITITEYLAEVRRDTAPWKSHPRRMLRHKAIIQCARIAFGFAGIYDEDEAERIVEAVERAPIAPHDETITMQERQSAVVKFADTIKTVKDALKAGEFTIAARTWYALSERDQEVLWFAPKNGGPFTTDERKLIKTPEFRLAAVDTTGPQE
jgi:phage recombination protein Bet